MTESGSGNEGSVSNASQLGVGDINYIQAVAATTTTEIEIPKESGWSKRKRFPLKLADALNRCLCRRILNTSMKEVLKCKQAGCKTQWVSTSYYVH
jgi:hypothetical protein